LYDQINQNEQKSNLTEKKQSSQYFSTLFRDDRPEAIQMRKILERGNNNSQANQITQLLDRQNLSFSHDQSPNSAFGSKGVIQRMPGDFDRINKREGKKILVSYKKGPEWLKLTGALTQIKSTSLYIGDKRFVKNWVEDHDFKILSGVEDSSEGEVDHFRPNDQELWTEEPDKNKSPGLEKKRELVELTRKVVKLAETMPVELQEIMPHDDVFNMTPEGQLEFCVDVSKGFDVGTLAKCLYTSYFYVPINKYLRKTLPKKVDKTILELIEKTIEVLDETINESSVKEQIKLQRVELQAEWMGEPKKGDVLNFPGFTSTHADSGGVENMATDISDGTFGKVTKMAVLIFQGNTKVMVPENDIKYFPKENEIILPRGMKASVMDIKDGNMKIPESDKSIPYIEYTLKIQVPEEMKELQESKENSE
jgi:hypothetical protein